MKNKNNWILKWESKHPYFRMEFYFRAEKRAYAYGSANKKLLGISKNNVMRCYYENSDQDKIKRNSIKILSDKQKINEYFNWSENIINKINKLLSENIDINNKDQLKNHISNIILEYQKFYTCYDLSRPEYFEKIEKLLKNKVNSQEFDILSTPTDYTTLDKEEFEFLKIVLKRNEKLLIPHQQKYGWIGASEDNKPWDINFYKKRYLSMLDEHIDSKILTKKNKNFKLIRYQKILEKQLDNDTKYFFNLIRKMSIFRLKSRLNWARFDHKIADILNNIATRYKISQTDIYYYNERELFNLIDGKNLDQQTLAKRKEAYALYYDSTTDLVEYSGENEVSKLENKEGLNTIFPDINIFKGSIAYKGFIKGNVKIINAYTDNQTLEGEKMKIGDILITGMTRPHLMPAIKKASAIITDEGGITSHAAIIARELKIPCIIGTKIATS